MNSKNNNNKKTQAKTNKKYINPFSMDIKDDFYDPFNHDDIFGLDLFGNRMFRTFRNFFTDFSLPLEEPKEEKKEEEKPEEVKPMEEEKVEEVKPVEEEKVEEIHTDSKPKEEEINTDSKPKEEEKPEEVKPMEEEKEEINTDKKEEIKKEEPKENNGASYYSRVYYSSYNNLNGEPNEESYQSQSIKQTKDGHDISETKEAYKNSNGVQKTAYQRGLDGKTTRFIKEKNTKTGKHNQHKVIKGLEEDGLKDFNKEYNDYSKKMGFRKNFHNLDMFYPFASNKKAISDGNHFLLHKLLF